MKEYKVYGVKKGCGLTESALLYTYEGEKAEIEVGPDIADVSPYDALCALPADVLPTSLYMSESGNLYVAGGHKLSEKNFHAVMWFYLTGARSYSWMPVSPAMFMDNF